MIYISLRFKNKYYIFLLTLISLATSTYKSVFSDTEIANTEELQNREKESEEDALNELEELDLELEDINIE